MLPRFFGKGRQGGKAAEFASKCKRDVLSVLCEWWKQDKRSFTAAQRQKATETESSFDVSDFLNAALARSFGN